MGYIHVLHASHRLLHLQYPILLRSTLHRNTAVVENIHSMGKVINLINFVCPGFGCFVVSCKTKGYLENFKAASQEERANINPLLGNGNLNSSS